MSGDPISPYIFVLCMARLAYKIRLAIDEGDWKLVRMSRQCPRLTHLFFTGDIILFVEANMK